jgi:hypothetical protein
VHGTHRENIKISAKEVIGHCDAERHKTWFKEECPKFIDRRKQAKLQWLQDPSVVYEDNLCQSLASLRLWLLLEI